MSEFYGITPKKGEYVQLLDKNNEPCENFTLIDNAQFQLGNQLFVIEDNQGEDFAVTRFPDYDTEDFNAWQQVVTATA